MKVLDQAFYLEDSITVAQKLLGKIMVRNEEGKSYGFRIVETEAYMGIEDKGAHVFGDKKTERTAPLYEIGGTTYIYLIYGMYHCLNIAANEKGIPHCVLIRAVEPVDEAALNYAKENRKIKSKKETDLTNGPGKLCKALKIDKSLNAKLVTQKEGLWIGEMEEVQQVEIVASKRINIPYAEEYQDKLWRYYIKGNPYVSIRDREAEETSGNTNNDR